MKKIAVLPGDGIGPEIIAQAVNVLKAIEKKYHHQFEYNYGLIGAAAIDQTGNPYPDETHELCANSDAILFGAIGDPKYDNNPAAKVRPEQGLLKMRSNLGLYANIRPVKSYDALLDASPLKNDTTTGGTPPMTDCTQPTGVSTTSIVKLDSTMTTISIKWKNPTNADSIMILAGVNNTLGYVTIHDSAYYAVGAVIPGSGATVYYRGTDSTVVLTGLQANTVYKIMIVPFNNKACNHGPNYANIAITSIKTAINTGVKYHNSEAEFALFPNPVNNGSIAVKFKSPLREEAVIEVLDIVGRKIETQKITQGTDMQTIDVSRLSKGTYIFNVVYKNTNNVSTFIIE